MLGAAAAAHLCIVDQQTQQLLRRRIAIITTTGACVCQQHRQVLQQRGGHPRKLRPAHGSNSSVHSGGITASLQHLKCGDKVAAHTAA